jgi:hypothetical protein
MQSSEREPVIDCAPANTCPEQLATSNYPMLPLRESQDPGFCPQRSTFAPNIGVNVELLRHPRSFAGKGAPLARNP